MDSLPSSICRRLLWFQEAELFPFSMLWHPQLFDKRNILLDPWFTFDAWTSSKSPSAGLFISYPLSSQSSSSALPEKGGKSLRLLPSLLADQICFLKWVQQRLLSSAWLALQASLKQTRLRQPSGKRQQSILCCWWVLGRPPRHPVNMQAWGNQRASISMCSYVGDECFKYITRAPLEERPEATIKPASLLARMLLSIVWDI